MSDLQFEWDVQKAATNLAAHQVSFDEAASVFADPLGLVFPDPEHSTPNEQRQVLYGLSNWGRLLRVSFTERGERIRVIGVRRATKQERVDYEEGS